MQQRLLYNIQYCSFNEKQHAFLDFNTLSRIHNQETHYGWDCLQEVYRVGICWFNFNSELRL